MTAFTELLAAHAPYIPASEAVVIQCHTCLDGRGTGEFASVTAWAEHIAAMLAAAGLRVTTRKPAKMPHPEPMW